MKILTARLRGTNQPRAVEVDANGTVYVTAAGGAPAAVTIADGADVSQGALADAEVAAAGPASVIAILKRLRTLLGGVLTMSIADGADVSQGALADLEVAVAGPASVIAILKRIRTQATGILNVQGTVFDAAAVSDVANTISSKLRGLVKWAYERMPASLGQGTMAQSLPVVVASDQTAMPVSDGGGTLSIDRTNAAVSTPIGIGANVSGEIDFRYHSMMVIHMPAAWTAASIGFQVSTTTGGTFLPLYDENGNLIQLNVTISRAYAAPAGLAGCRYVKLWSQDGAGANVNQVATRTMLAALKV